MREPRIGTFVREKRRQLTGVAIYLPDFAHGGIFPFRRLYLRMLETELIRRGLHCRIVVDNAGGQWPAGTAPARPERSRPGGSPSSTCARKTSPS